MVSAESILLSSELEEEQELLDREERGVSGGATSRVDGAGIPLP